MNVNVNENRNALRAEVVERFGGLEVGVFGLGIEAGTVLTDAGKVAMTEDGGIGVVYLQTAE